MKIDKILQITAISIAYIRKKDFYGQAAIIAYAAMFSVFPLLFFLATVLGHVAQKYNLYEKLLSAAEQFMPQAAYEIITSNTQKILPHSSIFLLIIGLGIALFSASNIMMITIKLINKLNGVRETRKALKKIIMAMGFLVVFAFSTLLAIAVVITIEVFLTKYLPEFFGKTLVLTLSEAMLYFIPFTAIIGFFYKKALNLELNFHETIPGAMFFVTSFVIFSQILRLIILFVDFNKTYGTIGGIILFLVWFRFIAFFLLTGSAINLIIKNRKRYVR